MIVAFDNSFLTLVFNPDAKPTPNPETGEPVSYCTLRVEALIEELSERGDRIIIPTPCLSEMLTAVPDAQRALEVIESSTAFSVEGFDTKCAVDLAATIRKAIDDGDKKRGSESGSQKVKFDRQIAVIAKSNRASVIYTDDPGQAIFAKEIGLKVKHTWDLDLPSKYAQRDIREIYEKD